MAIFQSARSYCRLSWEWWLCPLHLCGPVLLGCCRLQLTPLSLMTVLQPPLLCEGWGGHPLCLSADSPVLMDLNWFVIVQLSAVFCPSVQFLSFFCEAFSWTILDSSSFSLFYSGTIFHELVCSPVVLPQIFFNLTALFSYLVFFCLFHAPLDVLHFPVFLRSFRFKSFLSQFSHTSL